MTPQTLNDVLVAMRNEYVGDPEKAVRGQGFIKLLHSYIAAQLESRLTATAKKDKVTIVEEATLFGSHKPKDVDISVIHPVNGPLVVVGVRSQMSSVAKNALTYYQDIVGECISLQERFPLALFGYIYLMPRRPIKEDKESETINHARYAKMYGAISGRSGYQWKALRGVFDHFAYMVVDFTTDPPTIDEDLVAGAVPNHDLRISTFIDRMINTYKERDLFLDYFL